MRTSILFLVLLDLPWIAFVAYWYFVPRKVLENKTKEPFGPRLGVIAAQVVGFSLLFGRGFLDRRFVPNALVIKLFGLVLTVAGIALTFWARRHLGRYWSARITLKVGHELIRSGPYARVRHPIYSGILLAMLGTALAIGQWHFLAGLCVVLVAFSYKARNEESLLAANFGPAFQNYRAHSGLLIPRFR
jgi:protein-S-isoprenylcysteine O-methyltransferase Ste14